MLLRLALPIGLLVTFSWAGCSSDADQRDQNYGSDLGVGYQLPDAAIVDAGAATADGAGVGESDAPPGAAADAPVNPDSPPAPDGDAGASGELDAGVASVDGTAAQGADAGADVPVTMDMADNGG